MDIKPISFHSNQYEIETDVYQGPLDLLLSLIEKAELDITVLSLAQVTDQFLAFVHAMKEESPAEVSAFLVIAARLVQIKSNALLPHSSIDIPGLDEDSGDSLAEQLIVYRRFRQLTDSLSEREDMCLRSYVRPNPPELGIEPALDINGLNPALLSSVAAELFAVRKKAAALSTIMKAPRITIREKISLLISRLKRNHQVKFSSLLQSSSKNDAVVTFLAMLELIKQNLIHIEQEQPFSEIAITPVGDLPQEQSIISEFGE